MALNSYRTLAFQSEKKLDEKQPKFSEKDTALQPENDTGA